MEAAFKDIQTNPANIMKYQSNPKIQKVMEKISAGIGKSGMGRGFNSPPGGPPPPPSTGGASSSDGDSMGLD